MKIILAFFGLLVSVSAFCQSNYRPGYVIKANGDTIKGYINYREWNNSPKSIEFKQALNDKPKLYVPTEIKGFQITGRNTYASYNGPVSLTSIHLAELSDHADTSTRIDNAFIDVISAGKNLVLYHHEDEIRQRYFISEMGSAPVELKYFMYTSNGKVVTYAPFRQELIRLYKMYVPNGNDKTLELLETSYDKKSLIKYINIINGNDATYRENHSNKGNAKIHFFAGAGAAITNGTFSGPVGFGFPKSASYTTTTPLISGGIDIFHNNDIKNYFFSLSASYFSYSKTIKGDIADFSFKKGILNVGPQLFYNVYNKKYFKVFIGAGLGYSISINQSNQLLVTKSGYVVSSSEVDPYAGPAAYPAGTEFNNYRKYDAHENMMYAQFHAGVIIQNIQLYISATPAKWEIYNSGVYSASRRTMFMGVNYIF